MDEIADRLWSYNAAVMVGAGFSYNAEPVGAVSESFPSWNTLGDIFYRRLHGRSPGTEARYLSPLKLAEQVQAAFGRPTLDRMLRQAIPDLRYEPSQLHSELLRLPWQDVFTTNYDTLLERARASVTLSHFDVVTTTEDLLHANPPRIVKLHGSFPSPPFVITEEDYRRYPNDHAPFVNTVRQSLLEKTLCLVGFSGDDPNFLQWIGWLRDQVGKETAPKIFLVGVFDRMSEAERKLLNGRGIVPVDLSGFNRNPRKALESFLEHLEGRRPRALEWPRDSEGASLRANDGERVKFDEVAAEWRRQRSRYPGWVVVPDDQRQTLWNNTRNWLSEVSRIASEEREALETQQDLDLAFELAWRLDRCLFPLTEEASTLLEAVATKYGDTNVRMPEKSHWNTGGVFEAVSNIRLWLLRHYREEGLEEKWDSLRDTIGESVEKLLPEHKARLRLEEALQALYRFDPAKAKRLLIEWESNENLPFWEAKRAALMAELGEASAARSILESSLSAIREQQSLDPVGEDYTLVSQESVVMLLLLAVERGMAGWIPTPSANRLFDELSERWNELGRYSCDPRDEVETLSARLRHDYVVPREESTSHHFDLGRVSRTVRFGSDEEAITAYGLLRLYEDIGMPYRVEHGTFVSEAVKTTLPRVGPYSPHWALANIVRLGDAKAADRLFSREYVAKLQQDDADRYFNVYLSALDRTIAATDGPDSSEAKMFESLGKTLPEVFSRLCYKCSSACRERLITALGRIYGSKRRHAFANVRLFAERLLGSMSVEERIHVVPLLIDFPVPEQLGDMEEREYVNPLLLVKLPERVASSFLDVPQGRIDELLESMVNRGPEGDWAATSLVWLHNQGKLSGPQSQLLSSLLWDGFKSSGVPTIPGFYGFACLDLPHPPEVQPEVRVKEQLKSKVAASIGRSDLDDALRELRGSTGSLNWSMEEALNLIEQFKEWWQDNRNRLYSRLSTPFGPLGDQTKQTAWRIVWTLSELLAQQPIGENGEHNDEISDFVSDLAAHGIPAKRLEMATLMNVGDDREQLADRISAGMLDSEHYDVLDAILAARLLAIAVEKHESKAEFAQVGTMLVQGVEWRHRPALRDRLHIIAEMVREFPWFLSSERETSLLRGLEYMVDESATPIRGNDGDDVILTRASAAFLAFELFEHYQRVGQELPDAIQRWQAICGDPNEFAEVRNGWQKLGQTEEA
ncbi:MAG: SIR2 family protein [Gammaproteobacteria bacterium]|nr:SIR2 family protein [Gammaproteobacteria bacterium]